MVICLLFGMLAHELVSGSLWKASVDPVESPWPRKQQQHQKRWSAALRTWWLWTLRNYEEDDEIVSMMYDINL